MKPIIKKIKTGVISFLIAFIVVVLAYLYLDNSVNEPTLYESEEASEPQTVVETVYRERYNDLVEEILNEEAEYWENKATLSAERQASERLADEFTELANQKRLEEESL